MLTTSRPRLLVFVLLLFALAAFPDIALATHSWGNYHWARTSNPFTLKLGDNVSIAWDLHLGTTSYDWSLSGVLDTGIVKGGTKPRNCNPTSGRVEVCNERYGFNGWLGVAQIWVSGSHITQAITKLNDSYFNTSFYNTSAWRNLVMCQEVGHTLGLDHQDDTFKNGNFGTCMDYTNDPDGTIYGQLSNEHPNLHDYEQLGTIYEHTDSTTTVGQTTASKRHPPAMNDIQFDTPDQWGRLIRRSRDGRTSVYELDFGRGHKVFTFVIWAE